MLKEKIYQGKGREGGMWQREGWVD